MSSLRMRMTLLIVSMAAHTPTIAIMAFMKLMSGFPPPMSYMPPFVLFGIAGVAPSRHDGAVDQCGWYPAASRDKLCRETGHWKAAPLPLE
jgi:hypothetical protein